MTRINGEVPQTRACVMCGETFEKRPYGYIYKIFCSYKCQQAFANDLDAECEENPRAYEHRDCMFYKSCFARSAINADRFVCNPKGVGCRWCTDFTANIRARIKV